MAAQWRLREADSGCIEHLSSALGVSAVVARLMVGRGVADTSAGRRFLDPRLADLSTPAEMAGIDEAVERLDRAVRAGERVAVFGDYDVDGVTSAAIVGDYLERSGADVTLRVARRDEGYGFSAAQAQELVDRRPGVTVLTDCGTADEEAVELMSQRGVDVIAVDHHRTTGDQWPGHALVNPQRPDCGFTFKGLCSAGLAFYVMAALRRALERGGRQTVDPRDNLDLVALGTLADVAPLERDNRILVARGLRALARTERPGLRELLRLADLQGKELTSEHVSWRLGPRLNAPGRLGDAAVALECLWSRDAAHAVERARECDRINERRKEIQAGVLADARAQLEPSEKRDFQLVAGQGWHPGVVGIVAARLAEETNRPAAVVALEGDSGRGSARSVEGVDLFALLSDCGHLLERYGGHAAAAGFTVRRERIEELRDALSDAAGRRLAGVTAPPLVIDGVVGFDQVDSDLCAELARLEPYGEQNPAPVLAVAGARVKATRQVGANHLALTVEQSGEVRQAIGFGMIADQPEVGTDVDLAFVPQIDDYMGPRLRLRLVRIAAAGEGVS